MFQKIGKAIVLIVLSVLYVKNILDNSSNVLDAILYNRINFVLLLVILYLASSFIRACSTIFTVVLVGGILFHAYMYYNAYANAGKGGNAVQQQSSKCHGEGSTWYSKLNGSCY